MAAVDISVVTYAPELALLQQLLESLAEPTGAPLRRHLLIHDNSGDPRTFADIESIARMREGGAFETVTVERSPTNIGFGRGHNANAARGDSPFLLVLNQDCVLEPGALKGLVEAACRSAADVAAWEMRQIPYEHPKGYDPVTLETPWVSGAAALFRRDAFEAVDGFEPRIFMYGEDVDLSWRLRAAGMRLLLSTALRRGPPHLSRGGRGEAAAGLRRRRDQPLPARALRRRAAHARGPCDARRRDHRAQHLSRPAPGAREGGTSLPRALAATSCTPASAPTATFHPVFNGWSYELRREGAFTSVQVGARARWLPAAGLDPHPHHRPRRPSCARRSNPARTRPTATSRSW